MTDRVVDYSPLTTPLSPQEVEAWRTAARASGASWTRVSKVVTWRLTVTLLLGCTFMFLVSVLCLAATVQFRPDYYGPQFFPGWFFLGLGFDLVVGGGILFWIIRLVRREHRHWERWVRMD
ncbi:MAG: hypothetical protein ABIP33_03475, partial [Pseudolysinimonas sp.]